MPVVVNNNNNNIGELDERMCCGCFARRRKKQKPSDGIQEEQDVAPPVQSAKKVKKYAMTVDVFRKELAVLKPGSLISIGGRIKSTCVRFSIDLLCSKYNNNIALHFNPRLDRRTVVRNSKINNVWAVEEINALSHFDFEREQNFNVKIFVEASKFIVLVNGRHFCDFQHRTPIPQIDYLEVRGHISVDHFGISSESVFPESDDLVHQIPCDVDFDDDNKVILKTAYVGCLQGNMKQGTQLEVYGRVKLLPHTFYLNLQDGPQLSPHPNIPLHVNPRFSTNVGANNLIRNSWKDGSWQQEERAPSFPFVPGYPFVLSIRMEPSGFSVWVDGKLISEFPYRYEMGDAGANFLYIFGDVEINHVTTRSTATTAQLKQKFHEVLHNI